MTRPQTAGRNLPKSASWFSDEPASGIFGAVPRSLQAQDESNEKKTERAAEETDRLAAAAAQQPATEATKASSDVATAVMVVLGVAALVVIVLRGVTVWRSFQPSAELEVPASMPSPPPVRVGGNIKPPRKLTDVRPIYPPEAIAARVQGNVIIEAIIDTNGVV